ncbi:hypothetical protein B0H16DRAFT_1725264 [Mycena metata]|uniref:Uncharacterized protein n=1 Tax=Mycena metata TaxID=1033252 RepID=A0AAD7IUB8_9AGAR|nr:hypothetical protein B0H16DRAFT_1725264 [Mycena metata]
MPNPALNSTTTDIDIDDHLAKAHVYRHPPLRLLVIQQNPSAGETRYPPVRRARPTYRVHRLCPDSHRLHTTCDTLGQWPRRHLARILAHKPVLVLVADIHPARAPLPCCRGPDNAPSPPPPAGNFDREATLKRARFRS